jgi:hypothetical protein
VIDNLDRNDGGAASPARSSFPCARPRLRAQGTSAFAVPMSPSIIDVRQVRTAALNGQISVEQLLDIIDKQQQTIQRREREVQRLTERLAQYEPEVRREASNHASASQKPTARYSVDAENKPPTPQAPTQEIPRSSADRAEIRRRRTFSGHLSQGGSPRRLPIGA